MANAQLSVGSRFSAALRRQRQTVLRASLVVSLAWLTGCASAPAEPGVALHQHTQSLAESLFSSSAKVDTATQQRIGIGSIVPVQSLRQSGHSRDRIMVQQIQEGMISAAVQRGAQVVEYRTSSQLRLEADQELMLSRELAELNQRQRIDYFLTGTYSEVKGGLLVNLRLISVRDNSVVQAATQFFPWSGLGDADQLAEIRHGQLYRHAPVRTEPARQVSPVTPRHRQL